MSDSITITIPGTVDRRLSPNGRAHWRTVHQLRTELKERAQLSTMAAGIGWDTPIREPLTLHVLVAWEPRRKTMDDDNLWGSFKAARDGIATTLGINDSRMRCGSITQIRDPEKRGFIKVAIEEAQP